MKLIILAVLIACSLSAANPTGLITLKNAYNFMIETYDSRTSGKIKILAGANRNCLKSRILLEENGEKLVNEDLALFTVASATMLCFDDEKASFQSILENMLEDSGLPYSAECFKRRLYELNPESKFLEGWTSDESETCEKPVMPHLERRSRNFKREYEQYGIAECMNYNEKQVESDYIKESLLKKSLEDKKEHGTPVPEELWDEAIERSKEDTERIFNCSFEELKKNF